MKTGVQGGDAKVRHRCGVSQVAGHILGEVVVEPVSNIRDHVEGICAQAKHNGFHHMANVYARAAAHNSQ